MGTAAAAAISSRSFWLQSTSKCSTFSVKPKICFLVKTTNNPQTVAFPKDSSFSSFFNHLPAQKDNGDRCRFSLNLKANFSPPVGSTATEEPATKVKFQSSVNIPGCSTSLSLLGTGYREKVFAIIGVKVYAAGFYVNQSVFPKLDAWKGRSADDLKQDSVLFDTILKAPLEKSLQIVLVRDVDGKTFWDALDEAISPRIKQPSAASESALSSFRRIFQGRSLNKGTFIFLTWVDSIKMLVSSSSEGMPSVVDATIESTDVTSALFDVFLGGDPVSPSLKNSVANGLAANLK